MARYILTKDFVRLKESAGTIFNVSNVKVEISETALAGSGVILYPSRKMSFNKRLYAARAPSDCGVAVIGVITGGDNALEDGLEDMFDDTFSADEIDKLFGDQPAVKIDDDTEGDKISQSDIDKLFGKETVAAHCNCNCDNETITEADWQKIFRR